MTDGHITWGRRLVDLAAYAVGLTLLVAIALVPLSLLAGAGLNGVKFGLFLVGIFAFGYATLRSWPSRPDEAGLGQRPGEQSTPGSERTIEGVDPDVQLDPRTESRFESLVTGVPPLESYRVPPDDRVPVGAKLYVASLLMLAVSYAMEAVFGIRA
jgi:hypothetical protein